MTAISKFFGRLPPLRDIITYAQQKGDDVRIRDMKAMSCVMLLGLMGVTLSYFLIPGRSTFLQVFDMVALGLEIYGMLVLWITRDVSRLFYWFIPPYLSLMAFFVLINGTKEGDILGFLAVPCAAVVVLGPNRSIPWFLLCLGAMIVIPQVDPLLPVLSLPSAISETNPEGFLFQSPWKKPLGPIEGIAIAAVVFFIYFLFRSAYMQLDTARAQVEREKNKVDRLMFSVFPPSVASRLQEDTAAVIADSMADTTILFADIVAFTPLASSLPAAKVVGHLDTMFSQFDALCAKHGVEKIKTIGDAYMAVAGLQGDQPDHAERMAGFALDIMEVAGAIKRGDGQRSTIRVGLHSGPVVAGVIGKSKPFYDVWGESVNTAARLESHGFAGKIQVSEDTMNRLKHAFIFSNCHSVELKGIGPIKVCYLLGRKSTAGAVETPAAKSA